MLGPDATWGDVRAIFERSKKNPDRRFEDNILADPEILQKSLGRPDNEIIRKPGEYRGDPPEPVDDEEGLGDIVEFGLLLDGESAKMLVRTDFEEGAMYYRSSGEWVMITPDDEIPFLDNLPLTRVTGDATEIWDDAEENRTKEIFKDVLLDDAPE